jgi:hypothetical protein
LIIIWSESQSGCKSNIDFVYDFEVLSYSTMNDLLVAHPKMLEIIIFYSPSKSTPDKVTTFRSSMEERISGCAARFGSALKVEYGVCCSQSIQLSVSADSLRTATSFFQLLKSNATVNEDVLFVVDPLCNKFTDKINQGK